MIVAPKLQNDHVFVSDPRLSHGTVGKLRCGHRYFRPIADAFKRPQGDLDIFGFECYDEIEIVGRPKIPVGVYGEPSHDEIVNAGGIERFYHEFDAADFHDQITSAKDFSVLRKNHTPEQSSAATSTTERPTLVQSSGVRPPSSDQRKPSITPTMGLSA